MKIHSTGRVIFWITLGALFSNVVAADNKALNLVLNKLSVVKEISAEFIEIKTYSLLNEKIKLSGHLEYRAPDILIKKTIYPENGYFKVNGDALTIKTTDGEEHELLLSNYPLIEMFVEAYRGVLSGDLRKLKQYYDVEFVGGAQSGWLIKLTPLDEEALEYIDVIIINGVAGAVNKVTTRESGGDSSVLIIKNSASRK